MTRDTQVRRTHSPWTQLIFISLAVALITMDSTIMNVSISDIQRDLSLSTDQVQWVQEIYALVLGAGLLIAGALSDRFGRRRLLTIGMALFALASVASTLAPNGTLLIIARLVQGVGAAFMLPTTLALINTSFRGRDRSIAFGIWGATIASMAGIGMILGGWLSTEFTWRLSFLINVPLAIVVIVGSLTTIQESREPGRQGIDGIGALLSAFTFGLLIFGLIDVRDWGAWTTVPGAKVFGQTWPWPISPFPVTVLIAAITGVTLVFWIRWRSSRGRSSVIEARLFRSRGFRNGTVVALTISLGEFGITLILPLWLAFVLELDPLQSGLVLLPLAFGALASALLVRPLVAHFRALTLVRIGLVIEIASIGTIGLLMSPTLQVDILSGVLLVYGFGVGLASSQIAGVVLADIPTELSGQGAGVQSTARQVGTALGIAILGTALFSVTVTSLTSRMAAAGVDPTTSASVTSGVVASAGGSLRGMDALYPGSDIHTLAMQSFSDGIRMATLIASVLLLISLVATVSIRRGRNEPEHL